MNCLSKEIKIFFEEIQSINELPADEQMLLKQAKIATENAYAPFSHFYVGCALLLKNGEVILGNNQENIAFPSGICAERNALFAAGAAGKGNQILKIAITAKSNQKRVNQPVTPCGACRQVMVEYEKLSGEPFTILMQGQEGPILRTKGVSQSLLPFSFDIDF